jgi:hypothetical protein
MDAIMRKTWEEEFQKQLKEVKRINAAWQQRLAQERGRDLSARSRSKLRETRTSQYHDEDALDARGPRTTSVRPEHEPAWRPPYSPPSTERTAKAIVLLVCLAGGVVLAGILIVWGWVTYG